MVFPSSFLIKVLLLQIKSHLLHEVLPTSAIQHSLTLLCSLAWASSLPGLLIHSMGLGIKELWVQIPGGLFILFIEHIT